MLFLATMTANSFLNGISFSTIHSPVGRFSAAAAAAAHEGASVDDAAEIAGEAAGAAVAHGGGSEEA